MDNRSSCLGYISHPSISYILCDLSALIWREGTPFEAMIGGTVVIDSLIAEVPLSCKVNDRISVHSLRYYLIITLIMTLGASGLWLGTRRGAGGTATLA